MLILISYSIFVLIVTVVIFILQDKINKKQKLLNQDVFHLNQFLSSHNLFGQFAKRGHEVPLSDLRSAYIVFYQFRYRQDPLENDLLKINSENDYTKIVNEYLAGQMVSDFLERTRNKNVLEIYKTAFFILLILTQIAINFDSLIFDLITRLRKTLLCDEVFFIISQQ